MKNYLKFYAEKHIEKTLGLNQEKDRQPFEEGIVLSIKWKYALKGYIVMQDNSKLSQKVASSFLWKFGERILAQLITFIVSLVLARLLDPEHYGIIALVNVFITFANVFVSSGMGNSLIQKKDSDDTDFSSVFFFNLLVSVILYAIIFLLAPFLSQFYNMPQLTPVFRVMGLRLIVAGVNSVQHAYVERHMLFKRFFLSTLGGTVISGFVGIILAYRGFGIWALVAQYMVNTTIDTIVLFITVNWYPKLQFSFKKLKGLFSYGWKLLVSELVNTGYIELRSLVIGKKYTASDLAYYSRGQSFPQLIVSNISVSLNSVIFPVISQVQDNISRVKEITRASIRINSYVLIPLVAGLALVSRPFISLVLTDKWLPCVPYLQLSCLSYCLMPIQAANLQAIKALGRSDIYLKLEIVKKVLGILVLLLAMPFGTMAIAISATGANMIAVLLNAVPNRKLLNYTFKEQAQDYLAGAIPLFMMIVSVLLIGLFPTGNLSSLVIQICVGAVVFIAVSWLTKNKTFMLLLGLLKKFKR